MEGHWGRSRRDVGGPSIKICADHKTMIKFTVGLLSSHQTIFLNFHVHKNGRTAVITSVRSMNRRVHVQEFVQVQSSLKSWQSMNPGYFSCPVCTSSQIIFVCDTNARQCRNYTRNLVQIKIRHWIIQDQPHYWILSKWNSNLLFSLFLNHMIFSRFENFRILKYLNAGVSILNYMTDCHMMLLGQLWQITRLQ